MVAMTVEGPAMPRTVELVDPRSREWEPIDTQCDRVAQVPEVFAEPHTITARDGLELNA